MKTIFIKNGQVKNRQLVMLEFPFDFELKELIKTIEGAEWQPSLKAWAIPYSDTAPELLLKLFKGKAWLDYTQFRKVNPHCSN